MVFEQLDKEHAKSAIKRLIEQFKENYSQYKKESYNEAQVRKEYIDKLFKILGWDVDNEQGYAEQYKEVINEDSLKINGKTKAPDYGFRIGGSRKFFVEAKKPVINIKDEPEPAFQLKRYAWNAKLPISILTNFAEFAVYDCTSKPSEKDNSSFGRLLYLTFDQYENKFDEIFDLFSKERILRGSFDRFAEATKGKRGTAQVDVEFLKEIERWRDTLAKNIALRNKGLSIYELNFAVQVTIDRILFLRICEDHSIERYERLKELSEKQEVYEELINYFQYADEKYNSGIFNLDEDKITTKIKIDDTVLKNIIHELYYPACPYEFTVIGVEILGDVYEQFLGKVIKLTATHQAKIEEKPEVKKAGGIFYTPSFIVNYIVKNTVGKLLQGKTPKEIERLKILDLACGSGSFLLGVYTYLLDYHLNYYIKNDPNKFKKDVFKIKENQWALTSERRKKILLNNIHGVDIDSQAVEVTKLSLLLKVLENETKETVEHQLKLVQERVLPDLDNNIKCGNSLIGPEFYQDAKLVLSDTETSRRINIFDWNDEKMGFGNIMKTGGFDIIIGNPPYIQIQKLNEFYPDETVFYQNRYVTAREGNVDIYLPFIERSLSLLKKDGVLGFICPNRFFNSDYAGNLRKYLKKYNLYHLVNFRHYLVFNQADIYTCLLFLQNKTQQEKLIYKEIRNLYKNKEQKVTYFLNDAKEDEQNFVVDEIEPHFIKEDRWYFMTEAETKIYNKINQNQKLNQIYKEFFVGIQTSQDKVYILKYLGENEKDYHLFSSQLSKDFWLEKRINKPIIDNNNIKPYYVLPAEKYVIFPYKIEGDSANLYTKEELERNFPKTWRYLNENKSSLENREKGKMKGDHWYSYVYPKNLSKQNKKKILIPYAVRSAAAAVDLGGFYCLDNVGACGIIFNEDTKEDYYYFLAILNSPISSFIISKTSIFLSGGYYAQNKQFAGEIPIKRIDFSNKLEKETHNNIVTMVGKIIELKKKAADANLKTEKDILSRQVDGIRIQVNALLYNLYGLTSQEEKKMLEECTI